VTAPVLAITAVAARPGEALEVTLTLPDGATVGDAVRMLASLPAFAGVDLRHVGVHGEVAKPGRLLSAHDRLECYRPLLIDPAAARRARSRAAPGGAGAPSTG